METRAWLLWIHKTPQIHTHFDWIGVSDDFVDVICFSIKLPGIVLKNNSFSSTTI